MAKEDKFADELLTEDELDQVAGGKTRETAEDSQFLSIYGLCPEFSTIELQFTSGTAKEEQVKAAWAKVGVTLDYHCGCDYDNVYLINMNGTLARISREMAYQRVIDTLGDPLSYIIEHHL